MKGTKGISEDIDFIENLGIRRPTPFKNITAAMKIPDKRKEDISISIPVLVPKAKPSAERSFMSPPPSPFVRKARRNVIVKIIMKPLA